MRVKEKRLMWHREGGEGGRWLDIGHALCQSKALDICVRIQHVWPKNGVYKGKIRQK